MKIVPSDICTAFHPKTIGSKVTQFHQDSFLWEVERVVAEHDFSKDRVPGQSFLHLDPEKAKTLVEAGVGPKSSNPNHYVCREHRGVVSAYLKREYAAETTGCAVVVYTTEAYFADPDVTDEEIGRISALYPTHVLVAVLAFAGPDSPLPPYRLVWNLAGGNHEAATWSADEIRAKAKAAIEYDNAWSTVAD